MSLAIKESDLVKMCLDYLRMRKIFCYRNNTGGMKTERGGFIRFGAVGSPDIVMVINGKYIALEIKTEKGQQSEGQKQFQQELEKAGGIYLLVRSLEQLEYDLRHLT